MVAGHVDLPNQFKLGHVSFLTGQNIEILILKNFPVKPKMLPHMHKNVLLKSMKVLIAKSTRIA